MFLKKQTLKNQQQHDHDRRKEYTKQQQQQQKPNQSIRTIIEDARTDSHRWC